MLENLEMSQRMEAGGEDFVNVFIVLKYCERETIWDMEDYAGSPLVSRMVGACVQWMGFSKVNYMIVFLI